MWKFSRDAAWVLLTKKKHIVPRDSRPSVPQIPIKVSEDNISYSKVRIETSQLYGRKARDGESPEAKSLTLGDRTPEKRSKLGWRIVVREKESIEADVRCWEEVRIAPHPLNAEGCMSGRL